ncbi:PREDICTED: THO complex subunit 1-like [Acropora digitifera]|uniref:THO complex subunit 1-like n=1 Tax=Acropora digitifera TaxID=70779 RepID=UPI00077B258D|nr:PREDICTED: THO complex subunit 1-like [Acropora digitifera]
MADKETVDFKTAATRFGLCISKAKNVEDIADLTSVFQATPGSEQEKKLIVDQVFRDLVKEDVLTAKNMERCKFLISLVTKSAIEGHCSPNLVFILLSDVFDCITLEQCDPLFTFVEERVSIWTMPLFFSAGKNLLLRMCNDLLRRLSTSQNTIFCGRIQLFLARLFPLSEKSASEYITSYSALNFMQEHSMLLDLQLSDSNFRRTILVQILIIYQYLVGNVKFKSTNQVLNESQSAWVKEMTSQVYELLKETPPDGDKFAKAVEHILEREENWISWKNEGCPSFIKERIESDPKPTPTSRKRKASIGDEVASGWRSKKVVMGSNELTRLWNLCPDNLEACKADNRVFLPSLEEYFSEAIEQADPEAMVEDEYKVIKNSNYGWRGKSIFLDLILFASFLVAL